MNLQHIKNIIKEQLDQLRYQKTLNEGIPQWIRDCCNQRKDRQCCDIVADNPGKQIPKDVLNKLKKRLSEQMGNSGCKQSYNEEKTGGGYIVCNCGKGVVCQGSLGGSNGGIAIADCSCCLNRGKMAYQGKRL